MIFQTQLTIAKVIDIAKSNNVDHNPLTLEDSLSKISNPHPWYVQSAIGISAWVAALIFSAFANSSHIFPDKYLGLLTGTVLYFIGILVYRVKPCSITLRQFGLATSLSGMLVTSYFIYEQFKLPWLVGVFILTAETLVFWLHSDPVRRYIAVTNGIPALMFILASMKSALAYQLIVPLGLYAVYFLWSRSNWQFRIAPEVLKPLKYGLPVALLVIIHGLVTQNISSQVKIWDITNILTALILARVCYIELQKQQALNPVNILGSLLLLIAMAAITVNSPGILVSITVILIGFQNANRLLIFGAILAFIIFLGHFYFALQLNIINKAILLCIGGILFMFTAWLLHSRLRRLERSQ